MNECKSPLLRLTHGVPQESILGPVLFLIYINDISNSTSLNLLTFADDITIYHSDCDIDILTLTLNHELKNIYNWLCANKLCLNVKKTQYCIFNPKNSNYEVKGSVKINNEVINHINISHNGCIDNEIQRRMAKASAYFGRIRQRLWNNHHVSMRVKGR